MFSSENFYWWGADKKMYNICPVPTKCTLCLYNDTEGERDMAQWLERGSLLMSLPDVRFRIPVGAGFSEKSLISPLSILGHCLDVVSLGKALHPQMLHLTQVKMSTW